MGTFGRGSEIWPCCCSLFARSDQNSSFRPSLRHSLASLYTCFNNCEESLSGSSGRIGNSDVGKQSEEEDSRDECVPTLYGDTETEGEDFKEDETLRRVIVGFECLLCGRRRGEKRRKMGGDCLDLKQY